jgi:hypothetical protein
VFVYRLTEPVDEFDGLTSLPQYLHTDQTADPANATKWALQAVLALAGAALDVGWRGDMRHLPSVGILATPLVHAEDADVAGDFGRWQFRCGLAPASF